MTFLGRGWEEVRELMALGWAQGGVKTSGG